MTDVFYTFKKGNQHLFCFPLVRVASQILIGAILILSVAVRADSKSKSKDVPKEGSKSTPQLVGDLVQTMKKRGYHWDLSIFKDEGLQTKGYSVQGYPLVYYTCGKPDNKNSSLILANVHGDEVTPAFYGFRLVEWLKAHPHL